jgi:hypothetical protein
VTEPTKPRRRLSWQAVGRFLVHLLESFLWFDFGVLKAVGRFLGRRWRHVVLAAFLVLGVVGAWLLYQQPAPQGFSAVILVDNELRFSPGRLSFSKSGLLTPARPDPVLTMGTLGLRLTARESVAVHTGRSEVVLGAVLDSTPSKDSLVLRGDPGVVTLRNTQPASFRLWPEHVPQDRYGNLELNVRAARVGVRFPGVHDPDMFVWCDRSWTDVRSTESRGQMDELSASFAGPSLSGTSAAWHLSTYDAVVATGVEPVCSVRVDIYSQFIRLWDDWELVAESVAYGSHAILETALRDADTVSIVSDGPTDTLRVSSSLCSLTVYSPQFKGPIALGARTRMKFAGKIHVAGRTTNSGTRIELSGLASSITYQFLSAELSTSTHSFYSEVGQSLQVLPSKLEILRDQTVALAAAVFAFLILLGFIWDKFLKKD